MCITNRVISIANSSRKLAEHGVSSETPNTPAVPGLGPVLELKIALEAVAPFIVFAVRQMDSTVSEDLRAKVDKVYSILHYEIHIPILTVT